VSGNAVYFRIAGAPFADCAKNRRYLLNASTAYGRNFYLFIQDAYASGKEIAVETSGTCLLAPDDAEDVINIIPRTGNPSDNNYR
jgi:hypothetical protein